MTIADLKQILEDFDDNTNVCYQDKNNLYKYIPIKGFEIRRNMKGESVIVLLTTKLLNNEFNG